MFRCTLRKQTGFGVAAMLALAAVLVISNGAACGMCYMSGSDSVTVEVQGDALDKTNLAETKRIEQIIVSNTIHRKKVELDQHIDKSFENHDEKIATYAETRKAEPDLACNSGDLRPAALAADIEFANSVLARYDATLERYRLATDTSVIDDGASLGSRSAHVERRRYDLEGLVGQTRLAVATPGTQAAQRFRVTGCGSCYQAERGIDTV